MIWMSRSLPIASGFLVIIEQLLSNSLKVPAPVGLRIYFKDQTLYIKDSGIGIKIAMSSRVFERGFSGL